MILFLISSGLSLLFLIQIFFNDIFHSFRSLLLSIPLLVVDTKQDETEAVQLRDICMNYLVGLTMETMRKDMPKTSIEEQKRLCEMAAYFTHCNLQPIHQVITSHCWTKLFYDFYSIEE